MRKYDDEHDLPLKKFSARHPHGTINRSLLLAVLVLTQVIAGAVGVLVNAPHNIGIALLSGLPLLWAGAFGSIGGMLSILVNGALAIISLFYAVRALKHLKHATALGRRARNAVILSSITTAWWAAQVVTMALVVWVLSTVWG